MRSKSLPLLLLAASACLAQDQKIKNGLYEEDWKYTLAPGVKIVTWIAMDYRPAVDYGLRM